MVKNLPKVLIVMQPISMAARKEVAQWFQSLARDSSWMSSNNKPGQIDSIDEFFLAIWTKVQFDASISA